MLMPLIPRARFLAGAFLFFVAALAGALQIAAERPDGSCPPDPEPIGVVRLGAAEAPAGTGCLAIAPVRDLSDDAVARTASTLARLDARGVVLDFDEALRDRAADEETRFPFAVKTLSSAIRSGSSQAQVAVRVPDAPEASASLLRALVSEEIAPYVDAIAVRPGQSVSPAESLRAWLLVEPGTVAETIRGLQGLPSAALVAALAGTDRPLSAEDLAALARLRALFTADVSPDPTRTTATRSDGSTFEVLRFFNAKSFAPLLLLPEDPSGVVRLALPGGPYERAEVQNLKSGVRRDFDLKGASVLALDLSQGSLSVVLRPAARKGGEARTAVEVGARRGLTAEEIIARERAWDAGQREKVHAYVASVDTSLRFRVAEFPEPLDLTIRGRLFFERGHPPDSTWEEFYLNGVKWKGRTIPRLPILQPEKVTTLPLDIRLTEEYDYDLAGDATVEGRPAYRVDFRPSDRAQKKAIYRGTAWIDRDTFALLRRESIQLNLTGDALSSVQTEYYREVPGAPGVVLPLEIHGQQVFSTAGRTTAVEREVVLSEVAIDPPDFETRRREAYASKAQMVRDTDEGLRYLVPDPNAPATRVVEKGLPRKSLLGLSGAFYDRSQHYPLPLLGVQYFNFDLWGKNKQLSLFFGGVILFGNYTDPSLFGSHFDLGTDVFALAIPLTQQSYRNGREIRRERIKHLPAFFQVNFGHPIGPYLKASLGFFSAWDNYQRDSDTGPAFVTPVDTFTNGAELRLAWNRSGYNATLKGSYHSRAKWEPWGDPATSGYDPKQKDYWRYSAELSKTFFFSGFRRLTTGVSYMDGSDLDRFSDWDFGPFGSTRLRGFPGGSVRADRALLTNLGYGINVENLMRLEVTYDQALITQKRAGYDRTYFSGAGVNAAFNGPWENTRVRGEIGYPVVAHGVKGLTLSFQLLKLF